MYSLNTLIRILSPDTTPPNPDDDSVPDENFLRDKDAVIIHRFFSILPRRLLIYNLKDKSDDGYEE